MPKSLCCIDEDGDQYGNGVGCRGLDCDDGDATKFPGNPEVCDGKDNDCNNQKDEGSLCAAATCAANATGSYESTAKAQCVDGVCTKPAKQSCGRYTCDAADPACRRACTGSDDAVCVTGAYCDGASCTDPAPDGATCSRDRMCQSRHCSNGRCCAGGNCCATAADCAATYVSAPSCDLPLANCQGHRVDKTCTDHVCGSITVSDDRACTTDIVKSCAPYDPVSCSGSADQAVLVCPTSCRSDDDCLSTTTSFCQNPGPNGRCVARLPDGSTCNDARKCLHNCLNGFCCDATTGDCCAAPADCPSTYAKASTCDGAAQSCQGHRKEKACTNNKCASTTVDDDTSCGASSSKTCGLYLPVSCNGTANQSALACPSSCTTDGQCTTGNRCLANVCSPFADNGGACTKNADCRSGNCWNASICCSTACNGSPCDSCANGTCTPYADPRETTTCANALAIGTGQFDVTLSATIQSATDDEDWYSFTASDLGTCTATTHGSLTINVDVPAGTDYELHVFKGSTCATRQSVGDSTKGVGQPENVTIQDNCATDDSGTYYVQIARLTSFSCANPYVLKVSARL